MSELDDLVAACVANPDDDAPRLVWADAVGGERGEFVVLQCKLARDESLSVAERGALIERHDELLRAHGPAWSGLADARAVTRCRFRRGFVESIVVDVTAMTLAQMFARAPLLACIEVRGISRTIDYRDRPEVQGHDPIGELTRLFIDPQWKRLAGVEVADAVVHEITGDSEWDHDVAWLGDQVLELVASSGALAGFRALAVRDTFTPRGMHELLASSALDGIECLRFSSGEADRSQVEALFARTPKLRVLHLEMALQLHVIADLIPATVVELVASVDEGGDLPALASSPVAKSLERLQITAGDLHEYPDYFAAFPRLRALDVAYAGYGSLLAGKAARRRTALHHFARTAMPALRELRMFHEASDEDAFAIVDVLGGQLECLDILGASSLTRVDELRDKVAGYVRAGPYHGPADPLLGVGVNTREPWLRYGIRDVHR